MLLIGFLPSKIINLSDIAAQSLMNPSAYLDTVLPDRAAAKANLNEAQK
jgi:hypothetical protein